MWRYEIESGNVYHNEEFFATGYSGSGIYKNDPKSQYIKALGPICCGMFHIGPLYDSPNVGPAAMSLEALPKTDTRGRGDFKIHGDSKTHPGAASHGCIILSLVYRKLIASSGDNTLEVFSLQPSIGNSTEKEITQNEESSTDSSAVNDTSSSSLS